MTQTVSESDRLIDPRFLEIAGDAAEGVIAANLWDPTVKNTKLETFKQNYRERWDVEPKTYAAHAYDGVRLVIEAIRHAGLNRAGIRDVLAQPGTFGGVTGEILFDGSGANTGQPVLLVVHDGELRP